jgi:hypothetical protein
VKRERSKEKRSQEDSEATRGQKFKDELAAEPGSFAQDYDSHRLPLATFEHPLECKLQLFFALRPDGKPHFSAVSGHQNALGAFIGKSGSGVDVVRAKFPLVKIQCAELEGGQTCFWAEPWPADRPVNVTGQRMYYSLGPEISKELLEAEQFLLSYAAAAALPRLPNVVQYLHLYLSESNTSALSNNNSSVSSWSTPTKPKHSGSAAACWSSPPRRMIKRGEDYGRLKYEKDEN